MVLSLQDICCNKILKNKILKNKISYNKLNNVCYNKIVDKIMEEGINEWKNKIILVNKEIEIEEIHSSIDMFWGDPVTLIEVKKKNSVSISIYHPWSQLNYKDYLYYHTIAVKRNLINYPF